MVGPGAANKAFFGSYGGESGGKEEEGGRQISVVGWQMLLN